MTAYDLSALLELEDESNQQAWLSQNAPARDDVFIAALESEIQQRFRTNPQTAFPIIHIISTAAANWTDSEIEADSRYWQACTHYFLSEHREALTLFNTTSDTYQTLNLEAKVARTAMGQLNAMLYLGLYEEGLQLAAQTLEIARTINNPILLAKLQLNRANILFRLNRLQEAQDGFTAAQSIFLAQEDHPYAAIAQMNLANVQMILDDFLQAEQNYQASRTIFESKEMISQLAVIDHNLAELSFYQGEYQEALHLFDRSRQIYVRQNSQVDIAYVDLYRSEVYLALNLWVEALELTAPARNEFEKAGMAWETGRLWLNEAVALAHLKDGRSPNFALDRARDLFSAENNTLWLAFTDLYEAVFAKQQGELNLAEIRAQKAAQTFRQIGLRGRTAQSLCVSGQAALLEKRLDEADSFFNQALVEVGQANTPPITYACYAGLGQIAEQRSQNETARVFYRQAIQAIEQMQATIGAEDYKIAFLSDKLRIYEAHILLCLQAGNEADLNEAFATVEQAKSRALLDLVDREIYNDAALTEDETLLAELDRLKRELNWFYNRLNGSQSDSNERSPHQMQMLTTAVTEREQALWQLLNQWQKRDLISPPSSPIWTVNLGELQQCLPPDTLVLEFYTTDKSILTIGISTDENWSAQLAISAGQIADIVGQYRFQMNKFTYGAAYSSRHADALLHSANDTLHQLYTLLLEPIASQLTGKNLIIIPHGLLHYVPFHALFDGAHYLIESHTISYAPSATILYRMMTKPVKRGLNAPLIIGLADDTIPFAQNEAESISQLFEDAQLYLDKQATIENMSAHLSHSGLLHLSTHATFRADNPMFSALKMADGWLSVNDLYQMADIPPLVTLSACETGRHQIATGDELLGLSRGLLASGARSIVVSLWMVEDKVTASLMTHFYTALQKGESIHNALRAAQLTIKEKNPHPYYWSAFIVIGDVRNPKTEGGIQGSKERFHHETQISTSFA
ncbi:MAG: CHAT domain-containing protein [Anaerolineae bacterium]|nr:CHAT domain-containing protein [Anaerolineae bacterium]